MWRVGGRAGRKSLIRLRVPQPACQAAGRAPPADVGAALGIESPFAHSLGTRLLLNAAVPSQIARAFHGPRSWGDTGWCP